MLKSQPIIAFAPTRKPSRAKKFYANTLGLKLVSEDSFALVFEAGGTMLRVVTVQELTPAGYTILGWIVPRIAQTIQALKRRRVKFQRYPWMEQDKLGIWTSPSGAKIAWFHDPDGNILSLTQFAQNESSRTRKKRALPARRVP